MNLLIDFLTIRYKTGAGEYQRRVVYTLLDKIKNNNNYNIYAAYDSTFGIAYADMREETLGSKYNVTFIDLSQKSVVDIVTDLKIDTFFVACAQYWEGRNELHKIRCKTICVVHDLVHEEFYYNHLNYYFRFSNKKYRFENRNEPSWMIYFRLKDSTAKLARWLFKVRKNRLFERELKRMDPVVNLVNNNPNAIVVTPSEYTKSALSYYYDIPSERTLVLYSPERVYSDFGDEIENKSLEELIFSKKKYWLLLFANRDSKNADKAVEAFKKYVVTHPDEHLVAVGYPSRDIENIHNLSYLSDNDYYVALQHCYALIYPSFLEGFGYPPIEAMKFGKPVVASNTTSIPEVLGDSVIYFSPIYSSDIYYGMTKLNKNNYEHFTKKSFCQYELIHAKQEEDLLQLVDSILN